MRQQFARVSAARLGAGSREQLRVVYLMQSRVFDAESR